jgi:hypothetical protein
LLAVLAMLAELMVGEGELGNVVGLDMSGVSPSGERLRLYVGDDEWYVALFLVSQSLTGSRKNRGNPDLCEVASGRNPG